MHREEPLGVSHRLESSHSSFSLTRGLVRVLRPVVEHWASMVDYRGNQLFLRRSVTPQLIGHNAARHVPKTLEQLSKEPLRRLRIPALLHQEVKHFSALIDRAPQIDKLAVDLAEHLIEMPGIPRTAASATEPSRVLGSELQASEADCFMGHFDPTLEHHYLECRESSG